MANQAEFQKLTECLSDRKWRLDNLYHIKNVKGQKVRFSMNFAQSLFYTAIWYFNVILKARQLGFSTFICVYMLDTCLFNSNQKCGVIDASLPDAKKKLEKIVFAYNNLPDDIKSANPLTKQNTEEIHFKNGSSIVVGTSHRGDTLQILHISEYGKIAAKFPDKAIEIKTGALNAIHAGQVVFVESTAEGKVGEFFEICQRAKRLKDAKRELTTMDPRFHFYAWFDNPSYALSDDEVKLVTIPQHVSDYLNQLPVELTPNQKAWYAVKQQSQGEDMKQEFPSNPIEAFEGSMEGAFFTHEMAAIRQNEQIRHVEYNPNYPVITFWDLGKSSDQMVIWFYQNVKGRECFIDYHESNSLGWDYYADLIRKKPYRYEAHYFPHDGGTRQVGREVQTAKQIATDAGIKPIKIIPQTKSVWADIQGICKPRLRQCFFDEQKCSKGIEHLDNYRKKYDRTNQLWINEPQHNEASHGADGFRTYAVWREKFYDDPSDVKPVVAAPQRHRSSGAWMG